MRIVISGASGFIGGHVATRLAADGHDVIAMTRDPQRYVGAGTPIAADVTDPASLRTALEGATAAYYLIHSLDSEDFEERDAQAARDFALAATGAGVEQVIYLGGLGDDETDLSDHLRSRRQVEQILLRDAPTTALRAAIVVGEGSTGWEILCQLVEHLPVMVAPRWVQTRTQPIALDDAVAMLTGVLGRPEAIGRHFDIGGPDQLTYLDMMRVVADLKGVRRVILPVPVLTPGLSSLWLRLVTDVDTTTARALIESLANEVVVRERSIEELTGIHPVSFREAATRALAVRRARKAA